MTGWTVPHTGSSPRMRGALPPLSRLHHVRGIIPADAGSTDVVRGEEPAGGDHPRECGEHCSAFALSIFESGSSPRMRGAPYSLLYVDQSRRIIPADAGSTCQGHACGA